MTPGRVTIEDVRRSGHCVRGARRWFEARGFDFACVLESGVPADELPADDPMVQDVLRSMTERARG